MSFARNENATHLPSAFGDRDYQSLSVKCLYLVTFRQFRMQGKQKLLKEASCINPDPKKVIYHKVHKSSCARCRNNRAKRNHNVFTGISNSDSESQISDST